MKFPLKPQPNFPVYHLLPPLEMNPAPLQRIREQVVEQPAGQSTSSQKFALLGQAKDVQSTASTSILQEKLEVGGRREECWNSK